MALATPETLAPGIATVEAALAQVEATERAKAFSVTSTDGNFTAVANGDVSLSSVSFRDTVFAGGDAGILANGMAAVCIQALAQANTDAMAASFADAATYGLPGLPGPAGPPPTDSGFDRTVGSALSVARGVADAIRQLFFAGQQGTINAVVNGALELVALQIALPVPPSKEALQTATVAAVNAALIKAKNLFDPTTRAVIDTVTTGGPLGRQPDLRPKALLVVEKADVLRASDELLRSRIASLGFDVEIRKAPAVVTADANGRTLIVVSESVQSADVAGKFATTPTPIVALEPVQFRDLKMTGGTDEGEVPGQTQLQITAGHPLAAGLSGKVTVTKTAAKFEWGKPAATAIKIASLIGNANQWAIFAYDTGDQMVGANAPARRVGFFAGQDTPTALTDDGWRLFEAAVRWATAARALMTVASTSPLSTGDALIKKRLEDRHRLEVLTRVATDTRTSDLGDLRVHVISDSIVNAADVGARFLNSPAPTVNCEAALFDDMKMTGTTATDFGVSPNQTALDIVASDHPLAGGLSGQVSVVSSPQPFGWGKVGTEGIKIATLTGQPNQAGIFAYESGANMVGIRAPAPRVGFFAEDKSSAAFTPAGLALFDAAVRWARQPRAMLVTGAPPLSTTDQAIRSRLEKVFGFVVDVRLGKDAIDKIAVGKKLIIISESAVATDVGSRLTSLAIPILALAPTLFDDLKMTDTVQNTDFGEANAETGIDIVKTEHPLAAGLPLGGLTVAFNAAKFGWGKPGAAAVTVARVAGKTNQSTIFGYESGAAMVGASAPARRVGWFAERDTLTALNETGLRLFDAAVLWAAGRLEIVPQLDHLGDLVRGAGQSPTTSVWQAGVAYAVGDQVMFGGAIYRCRQAHTSQVGWEPPKVFALWERIDTSGVWLPQVTYKVGDQVTLQGHTYRCLQTHLSQPDWQPPTTPALWQLVA